MIKKNLNRPQQQTEENRRSAKTKTSDTRRIAKNSVAEDDEVEDESDEALVDPDDLLAEALDDDASGFDVPELGTYSAVISEAKLLNPSPKGRSVQVTFVLYVGDRDDEKTILTYFRFFKILEADLRTKSKARVFYQRFMAQLGYEQGNRGVDALKQITEEQPAVTVKVTENAGSPNFPNIEVTGVLDEDTDDIEAIREAMENEPY